MPIIGELVAGGVPEHVRVDREWNLCGLPSPGDRFQETCGRGGTTALGDENVSRFFGTSALIRGCRPKQTVCRWLARHPEFRRSYAIARDCQMEDLMDEMLKIADDPRGRHLVQHEKSSA